MYEYIKKKMVDYKFCVSTHARRDQLSIYCLNAPLPPPEIKSP